MTKLRPGNVHSAEGSADLLLLGIERQQRLGREVVFRADAASPNRNLTGIGGTGREVRYPPACQLYSGKQHKGVDPAVRATQL